MKLSGVLHENLFSRASSLGEVIFVDQQLWRATYLCIAKL
jgi:hypothetical protein